MKTEMEEAPDLSITPDFTEGFFPPLPGEVFCYLEIARAGEPGLFQSPATVSPKAPPPFQLRGPSYKHSICKPLPKLIEGSDFGRDWRASKLTELI